MITLAKGLAFLVVGAMLIGFAFLVASIGFVLCQTPPEKPAASKGSVNFAEAIATDYAGLPDPQTYLARDGATLHYRRYDGGNDRIIVLLHGSGWHGMQFHKMAKALSEKGLGTVIVPDLRGHGAFPERRGDIDYIGQFEDDIADLIEEITGEIGEATIVIGGHSSGGGLAVRFAGGVHGARANAYLLLAPFLKYNAPTTKPNSGGWAHPATGRIVGLTLLNAVGIKRFNHLPVISFAMPEEVLRGPYGNTATTTYSYRLNTSFAPRANYADGLRSLTKPFLLLAGNLDEAFYADRYEEEISAHTSYGTYAVIESVTHLGLVVSDDAIERVANWIHEPPRPD